MNSQIFSDDAKLRIGSFIESAIKKEISWVTLTSILNEMTNNLGKSKQVIEILLQTLQSKFHDEPIDGNEEVIHYDLETKNEELNAQEISEMKNDENGFDPLEETSPQEEKDCDSFVCEFCDKVFPLNIAYKKHMKTHISMDVIEEFKDKFYTFVGEKEITIKNENLPKEESKETNDSRIVSIAISKKSNLTIKKEKYNGKKKLQCKICLEKVKHESDLKVHESIHKEEKPFKCKICTRRFNDRSSCGRHEKLHATKKPHKCNICSKEFIQLCNLKIHERNHTGEKPFKCDRCGKGFISKQSWHFHSNRKYPCVLKKSD